MTRPLLAAVSLEPSGGGVAVVSRLLWEVFTREWGDRARLLTLVDGAHAQPSFGEKSRYALRLARLQASAETDWMLFAHMNLAKPLLGLPRTLHKPYAVFLHGIEAWRPLPAAQLELLAHAERRLANSTYTARRIMTMHPGIGAVDPCPLGLPPDGAPRPSGSARPFPDFGAHAVLMVGRMLCSERYKGHDEMIDAWPLVVSRVPDAQLVIAGGGDDTARLRQKASASAAASSIHFTGFVPQDALHVLYERAAIFALPSRGEGFGLVYLEAMSHHVPCLGSVHDAAGDVIADGATGRLVDQDDRDLLAATLADLLENEAERRRMGEAGYRRVQEHFTFESFASRFLSLAGLVPCTSST